MIFSMESSTAMDARMTAPLLVEQQQHQRDGEEENIQRTIDKDEDEDAPSCMVSFCDILMSLVLIGALFIQFGFYFLIESPLVVGTVSWTAVNFVIVWFVVTSILFRYTIEDVHQISDDSIVMLIPEIIILCTVMICSYHENIIPAFLFLIVGKSIMAFTVIVLSSYQLVQRMAYPVESTTDSVDVDKKYVVIDV